MKITIGDAKAAAEGLLGARVDRVEQPGGGSRRSMRFFFGDLSVIVTRRKQAGRAELESQVLRRLRTEGAPVPEILGYDGEWLIQEDLGSRRLSEALLRDSPDAVEKWLRTACESLAAIHRAGRQAGLERQVVALGQTRKWFQKLVATPDRVGRYLNLPAPDLDAEAIVAGLSPGEPWFIKWDARPGNAVACNDGRVAWFDWEHCGCRNRLDDLAWLLGDEYVLDRPDQEARLIDEVIHEFGPPGHEARSRDYLALFGSFHMAVRLALIADHKGQGDWWDEERCLLADKIGVTARYSASLCRKAARWSGQTSLIRPLASWFEDVGKLLAGPDD